MSTAGKLRRGIYLLSALTFSFPRLSAAWDGKTHSTIARRSLQNALKDLDPVQAETLEAFLATTEFKTVSAFAQALHLNPSTKFDFKLQNEKLRKKIPLIEIFETYINEPDWGMDREICRSYSGLCPPDYEYMGALKPGVPSQAFRHMYWPNGYIALVTDPLSPWMSMVRFPVKRSAPLGEAPDRSQRFFDLSVRAAKTGHPYWAARFLAWSMHYVQDVSQPFHAAQFPSLAMIYWKGPIPSFEQTIRKLTYYHIAFEDYVTELLTGAASLNRDGEEIKQGLRESISDALILPQNTAGDLVRAVAAHSADPSFEKRTAEATIRFFPPFPECIKDLERYLVSDYFKETVHQNASPGPLLNEVVDIAKYNLTEGSAASHSLLLLFYKQASATPPSAIRLNLSEDILNISKGSFE